MTDAEDRHEHARRIFGEAMQRWYERGDPREFLNSLSEDENGDPVLIYSSSNSYGNFLCEFKPLGAIEWIIGHCARIVDEALDEYKKSGGVVDDTWFGEWTYNEAVDGIAVIAAHRLFIGMRTKLCEATEDNLQESLLLGEVAFRGRLRMFFEGVYEENREAVDCRAAIAAAVNKVADRKREALLGLIGGNVPRVFIEGAGRRIGSKKTEDQRARERAEYEGVVERAYRQMWEETGSKPIKTDVARAVGPGGLNRSSGTDTRLTAFNFKLKALGIDYEKIAERVDRELKK